VIYRTNAALCFGIKTNPATQCAMLKETNRLSASGNSKVRFGRCGILPNHGMQAFNGLILRHGRTLFPFGRNLLPHRPTDSSAHHRVVATRQNGSLASDFHSTAPENESSGLADSFFGTWERIFHTAASFCRAENPSCHNQFSMKTPGGTVSAFLPFLKR